MNQTVGCVWELLAKRHIIHSEALVREPCIACVQISAKKGMGVDDLLETVLLVAEVEQLTANPQKAARGTVVEAHLDKRTGPVATLLVATGTLKQGDVVHAGATYGRVWLLAFPCLLHIPSNERAQLEARWGRAAFAAWIVLAAHTMQ